MARIDWGKDNARRRSRDSETVDGQLSAGALAVFGARHGRRRTELSKAELRAQAEKAVADLAERKRAAATMRAIRCPNCGHGGAISAAVKPTATLRCVGCDSRFAALEFEATTAKTAA